MLCLNHNTHSNITGSSPYISSSIWLNCGVTHKNIQKVLTLTKSYTTHIGEGVFPIKIFSDISNTIRKTSHRYNHWKS